MQANDLDHTRAVSKRPINLFHITINDPSTRKQKNLHTFNMSETVNYR